MITSESPHAGATWEAGATEATALYRFALWRTVGDAPGRILFVGLNPSTAGERVLDPTMRREIDFAQRWGFGGLDKANLFGFRSPFPKALKPRGAGAIGSENDATIRELAARAAVIVCAWGTGTGLDRRVFDSRVLSVLWLLRERDLHVIEVPDGPPNLEGCRAWKPLLPRHPLYLPKESRLALWRTRSSS